MFRKFRGGVTTRRMTRRANYEHAKKVLEEGRKQRTSAHRNSARRSYARRRKLSHCRGLMTAKCRHQSGCKVASGKKRSFCRKSKSVRRRR